MKFPSLVSSALIDPINCEFSQDFEYTLSSFNVFNTVNVYLFVEERFVKNIKAFKSFRLINAIGVSSIILVSSEI
jgi:hypothetical protein